MRPSAWRGWTRPLTDRHLSSQTMTPATRWFDNENKGLRRCWHPVARASDLDGGKPVGVELLGERWCVVRLNGELAAFPDACPHRLSPLSAGAIEGDTLRCAYHGYRFAASGACVEIPAVDPSLPIPRGAHASTAAGVCEHLDLIWLAPETPVAPLPAVPEHDDPSFVNCPLPTLEWNASAAQMADNFLDMAHVPFVHLNTFGEEGDKLQADYTVDRDGWQFSVVHRHTTKALADSMGAGDDFRVVERELLYVFTAPHHVYLRITYLEEDAVLTISFCHQPVNATTTRLYCTDYRNDIEDTAEARAEAADFQLAVAAEDKTLLERMHRKAVPLGSGAEYHSKADRITLEMRRMLADLTV